MKGSLRTEYTPARTEYEVIFNHPDNSTEAVILRINNILGGPGGLIHYEMNAEGAIPVVFEDDQQAYDKVWEVFTDRFENPDASLDKS